VRRALMVVLLASGAKLLGASTGMVLVLVLAALAGGVALWSTVRVRHGLAPFAWQQRRRRARMAAAESPPPTAAAG
jgi:hypothetical protein